MAGGTITTGNGYYGGLQFSPRTWKAFGGQGSPHKASKGQQIAVAEQILAKQGWKAWPACSKKLGFRADRPRVVVRFLRSDRQRTATSVAVRVCRTTSATACSGPLPAPVGAVSTTYTGRSTAT